MAGTISRASAASDIASLGTFAPPGWQDAVNNVFKNGREEDLDEGTMIGIKTVTGDPSTSHQINVIQLWVYPDPKTGKFVVAKVSLDYQDWQLKKDGSFYVDEWIHNLNRDASSWSPLHYFEVVRNGSVDDGGSLPQSAGDPRASLARLIAGWAKYRPAPAAPASPPPADVSGADHARRASDALTPAIAAAAGLVPPRAAGISRR